MASESDERVDKRETLERVSEGVLILDSELVVTYINSRGLDLIELDTDEVVGQYLWDIFPTVEETSAAGQIEEAVQTGAEATYERYNEQVGRWFSVRAYSDSGGATLFFKDITERKRRQQRVKDLHEETRRFLQSETQVEVAERACVAASESLGFDLNGVYLYDESNDRLTPVALSEGSRELIGEPPVLTSGIAWEVFQDGEPAVYGDVRAAEEVYDDETPMRSEMFLPLGEHGILIVGSTENGAFDERDVTLAKLLADNASAVIGQIEREQRLRERERELQRAETLFENAQDAFFLVNVGDAETDYTIERVNPAYESLSGLSGAEVQEKTIGEIFDEADAAAIRSRYDQCVNDRETVEYVEELSVPETGSYWESRIAPVIVDDEVVQIAGATRNITDRKTYERQLEEQRDRLEVLNEMVRHDIRNDLQVISSYAELLTSRVTEENREYVERILNNAETAVELTRTARDLSGTMLQTETSTEPVPMRRVLLEQVDEIRTTYTDAVVTIDGQIPHTAVVADDMLASVFRNIVKNAIQHNDKDVPTVNIAVAEQDDRVRVTVADNGPGIPDNQKGSIFGKGEKGLASEGTGIGLYLVNTLVERYGGTVQVHDNEPVGAIVTLTLNCA